MKKTNRQKNESYLQNVDNPLTKIHFDKKHGLSIINSTTNSLKNIFFAKEFQKHSLESQPTTYEINQIANDLSFEHSKHLINKGKKISKQKILKI